MAELADMAGDHAGVGVQGRTDMRGGMSMRDVNKKADKSVDI
jgi:hypothetical protein